MSDKSTPQTHAPSRRNFLTQASAIAALGLGGGAFTASTCGQQSVAGKRRPRVAAIFTVLRFRSHAYNILENFLGPYYFCGKLVDPGVDVVSFYADQFPDDDMAREVSKRFGIPLCRSIDEALTSGGQDLAVDAVLSIAEHGDYPFNNRGQQLYPRKEFFDQSVAAMKRCGRFVPFFNDKHLSYRWDWAKEMYDTSRQHGFPLMAGSSVPLAQRIPMLELPPDSEIKEAVSIHGGGLESYDFHGLEVLESIVESRRGGETGISNIELLTGEKFTEALREGRWSLDLVDAAMSAELNMSAIRQSRPTTGVFAARPTSAASDGPQKSARIPRPNGPHAIILNYRDGLKATVLKVGSDSNRWNFACRLKGESKPRATAYFNSPWGNRGLFKALSHAIQNLFTTGEEPYRAERTLLTTGAVEAVMQSYEHDRLIETPHLEFEWQPTDWASQRENGATWRIVTADSPQPATFAPRSFEELR